MLFWSILFFLLLVPCNFAETVVDLNGEWLTQSGKKGTPAYSAVVPGNIYTDLLRNGTLKQDPYYRFNDVEYRWVGKQDWSFWRTFQVPDDLLNYNKILLKCDGLDTVSSVYVNDKLVGSSENQFIQHFFDIKDAVKAGGDNSVIFRFKSPTAYAADRFYHHIWERSYIVPPMCPVPEMHGECHANFIRKAQSSFSWDWGPAFPTVGIWRNVSVIAFNTAFLEAVTINTSWAEMSDTWKINLGVYLLTTAKTRKGTIKIEIPELELSHEENVDLTPDLANFTFSYDVNGKVEKWWPFGYGKQKLYEMKVTVSSVDGKEKSEKTVKVGFRTVQLVEEPLPKANTTGLTFYFRVNGIPIWVKGSNWIPANAFQDAVTPDYMRWLLESTTAANMNMLRVWGGGYYESDLFYETCDELGIMIWQDYMFACAMYPSTDDFLASVRQEVRDNVLRMQHHASIALWSGNNENEVALVENWYATFTAFPTFKSDYIKLYIGTVRDETAKYEHLHSRPWVASSPSNGKLTEEEGWVSEFPKSNLFGDVHFYSYLMDPWDWKLYPPTRFGSEYGFQSWESVETLEKYSDPVDRAYFSKFANHRQHHPLGQTEMLFEIARHFKLPGPVWSHDMFPHVVYLTQINQAMGVRTETEFYRRIQNIIFPDSAGYTQGALYWQLNSIWPCPSWASIEFGGKWKMSHYYARAFFEPVLLSPYVDEGKLYVSLINDHLVPVVNDLRIRVFEYGVGFRALADTSVAVNHRAQGATTAHEEMVDALLARSKCSKAADCILVVSLGPSPDNDYRSDPSVFFLGSPRDATIPKAKLTITDVSPIGESKRSFDIIVEADNIALFVWIEAIGVPGHFSKNGHTQFEAKDTLQFFSRKDIDAASLRHTLKIMSLADIY